MARNVTTIIMRAIRKSKIMSILRKLSELKFAA